jgi:23S rRNA (guanosine2251-2'-O)-methyltransferase
VPQRRQALERIVLHATNLRIPIVEVEGGTLNSLAGFDGHQGVALVVRPRTWATLEDILARATERGEPAFLLVLDSLEDPQNVGTLLRSAEAVGVHGVVFPTHRQAPLSPAAIKASAGATEHLLLAPADDLSGTLADLHARGVRVAAADGDAPLTASEADLRGPIALVVGSEGHGIGPAVRRRTDLMIRIPMRGAIGSLNAAVAGSILLFEILDQRGGVAAAVPKPAADQDPAGEPDRETTSAPKTEAPKTRESASAPTRRRSKKTAAETAARPASDAEAAGETEPAATAELGLQPDTAPPAAMAPRAARARKVKTSGQGIMSEGNRDLLPDGPTGPSGDLGSA